MASLDFPSNPTNGQTYALNGVTYYYNSTMGAWLTQLTSMNLSTSSNTQVLFNDAGLANGSSLLVFDKTTGNLGIGNTSPVTRLHLNGAGAQVRWDCASATDSRHEYYRNGLREAYINWDANNFNFAATQSSGIISFATGGTTERMRITSAGRVGIGSNTTPSEVLTVMHDNAYAIGLYRDLDYNSVGAMGTILSFGGRVGSTRTESSRITGVLENTTSGSLSFSALVSGSMVDKLKLKYTGEAYFPYGQIQFPATQNASSDANTLDDYEEGTFTPTVAPSSGTITSYIASGVYTKIGRVVEVTVSVGITNVGTAAGAYLNVYGLPFTSGSNYFIGVCRENAVNGYLSQVSLGSGATSFAILLYNNNGVLVNGGEYKMSIVYRTS